MIKRIAILGTGLLGTSVGLALRTAGYRGSIVGWNRGAEGAQAALALGAIDSVAADAVQAARARKVRAPAANSCEVVAEGPGGEATPVHMCSG